MSISVSKILLRSCARAVIHSVVPKIRAGGGSSSVIYSPLYYSVCGMASSPAVSVPGTVRLNDTDVPLTFEAHLPPAHVLKALQSVPFTEWTSTLDPEFIVASIHIQSIDIWADRMGFMKFKCAATFHGKPVPGIVFMRGGAVAILVVLNCEGQKWALCCRQPRLPVGRGAFLEIPAGMLDGSGHFSGVAAKELKEETGIEITDDQLVDMTALALNQSPRATGEGLRGMYPSVGACDEFIRILYFQKEVDAAELQSLHGKATGCITEDESITLDLIKVSTPARAVPIRSP
jgi:ADP-sugar diphosphatase